MERKDDSILINVVKPNIIPNQLLDFDLSIVMPFYKRLDEFKRVFPAKEPYFRRNGIEVIIVADEPSEKDKIKEYIKNFPFICWKVIVNEQEHLWRNPAKSFNVGIRQSTKKYVLIMDPELEFYNDVIYILREHLDSYANHFAVGQVTFLDINQEINDLTLSQCEIIPYGSIMARKEYFEQIGGYNERYEAWGGEDDNLRMRFELSGIKRLLYPEALLIHREDFSLRTISRNELRSRIPDDLLTDMLLPIKIIVNGNSWGTDFNKIIYDWKDNYFAREQCLNYLYNRYPHVANSDSVEQQILKFEIPDINNIFEKKHQLIALIPTYNEAENIIDCLRSVEKHCDGIIVLDDESSDGTYELINSEKLLLKARKKRECFDDRQNRNILLDLAYFFKSNWFIFIDADERFDDRFVDLSDVMSLKDIDTVGVWIANLWNNEETYRTDFDDSISLSENGLWLRLRMFKNKGPFKITHMSKLHFNPLPYRNQLIKSRTLLLHYGYLTNSKRKKKDEFYKVEDIYYEENSQYYSKSISENINIKKISEISL